MDIANQLFSFTLGVEPNKDTLQRFAGLLSTAGKSSLTICHHASRSKQIKTDGFLSATDLSQKQKALAEYADTIEGQKFISGAPVEKLPLSEPQIKYIQAAPTPQAAKARKAKLLRDPVVWQISEKQLKELQWKQKQLLRAQKAELERKKKARASRPPPPKLGQSKATLRRLEEGRKTKQKLDADADTAAVAKAKSKAEAAAVGGAGVGPNAGIGGSKKPPQKPSSVKFADQSTQTRTPKQAQTQTQTQTEPDTKVSSPSKGKSNGATKTAPKPPNKKPPAPKSAPKQPIKKAGK